MSTTPVLWLTIISIGIATFAMRLSFTMLADRIDLPIHLQRALRFVPVAALTALIAPELVVLQGTLPFALDTSRLLAGLLAAGVAWRTRNVLLTISAGMASLWILQAFLS